MPGLFVAMLSFPRSVLGLKQSTEPTQVQSKFARSSAREYTVLARKSV
jgi:hypothetical protein